MTDRDKIREQLSAWLDGELSDSEVRRLEKAVELDAGLATELQQLRATRELIRRLPRERAPEDFVDRVIARAERMNLVSGSEDQVEQPSPLRWIRTVATAAILLIAVGTGIVITLSLFSPQFDEHVASNSTPTVKQPGFEDGDRDKTSGALAFTESRDFDKAGGPSVPEGYCDGRYAWFKNGLDLEAELENYYSSDIRSIEIYTDNLEIAEKDVVKVLDSNGIQPVKVAVANNLDRANAANNATGDIGLLDNSYQVKPLNRAQVQIVVLVDEDQLAKLDKDLKKVISEQRVAQAPPVEEREIIGKAGREFDSMASAIAKAEPAAPSGTVRGSIDDNSAGDAADEPPVRTLTKGGHVTKTDAGGSGSEAAAADVESSQTISPEEGEKASRPAPNAEQALETENELVPDHADKPAAETAGGKTTDESPSDTCTEDAEKLDELTKTKTAGEKKPEKPAGDEKDNTTNIQRKIMPGTTTAPETAPASRGRQEATQAKKATGTTIRGKEESTLTQAGPTAQQAARMQRRSPRLRPVLITLNDSEGLREVIIAKQRAAEKIRTDQSAAAEVSRQAQTEVPKETGRSGGAESQPAESK